jgi:hypothetical protein
MSKSKSQSNAKSKVQTSEKETNSELLSWILGLA